MTTISSGNGERFYFWSSHEPAKSSSFDARRKYFSFPPLPIPFLIDTYYISIILGLDGDDWGADMDNLISIGDTVSSLSRTPYQIVVESAKKNDY